MWKSIRRHIRARARCKAARERLQRQLSAERMVEHMRWQAAMLERAGQQDIHDLQHAMSVASFPHAASDQDFINLADVLCALGGWRHRPSEKTTTPEGL